MHSILKQKLKQNGYSIKDIERGIREVERLRVFAEQGDMNSINLIVDAERIVNKCGATDLQINTAYMYYREGMRLQEIGEKLGVTPQAVSFNLKLLKVRIQQVLTEQNQQLLLDEKKKHSNGDDSLERPKIFIDEESIKNGRT